MSVRTWTLGGMSLLAVSAVAIAANVATVATWLGLSPPLGTHRVELTILCEGRWPSNPGGATRAELSSLDALMSAAGEHDGRVVQMSFRLETPASGACPRLTDPGWVPPDYDLYPGVIELASVDATEIYREQPYVASAIDARILQISAFWPETWPFQITFILPHPAELQDAPGYAFGDKYCPLCFTGPVELRRIAVPAGELIAARRPR